MTSPEYYREIDSAFVDELAGRVIHPDDPDPRAAGIVRHLAQGFFDMLNERLEVGEDLPLDVFRPLGTEKHGFFIERTTTGLAIRRRLPNPNDPIPPSAK